MTINIRNVQRARIAREPNGAFATEIAIGLFLDMPFVEGSMTVALRHATESPMHSQQHLDGYPEEVLLPKDAQVDFQINLETLDTKPGSGITAGVGAIGRLLRIFMGGEHLGTGTTVTTAATTTNVPVTSTAGFAVGSVAGFATSPDGGLEMREIKNISGGALVLKLALSSAPADASVVYAAATYYMNGTDGSETDSLQMTVEGIGDDDRWLLLGGQLASTPTIELPVGGIPRMTFSVKFAQWFRADGVNTTMDLTASALAFATYVNAKTIVHADSEFRSKANGNTVLAGSLIDAPEVVYTPNITYAEHRTSAGTNTIAQFVRNRSAPVIAGTFTTPLESQFYYTARDDRQNRAHWLQIGTSPTDGGILLSAPTCQVTDVQLVDSAGIQSQQVSWKGRLDEDTTSPTTDLARSAFRVAFI